MTLPFYASAEQVMRDRSELARKGIARGRSVTVMSYVGGVLFVAENRSRSLRKVSEIYDRIGFAAVGRYNEYENLRTAGIRAADVRGYTYDRRDVTGRWLANVYAQTMGAIFTEQQKPFEVELCVAEVLPATNTDQIYRITYDGSITDEPGFVVIGGQTEPVSAQLRESYRDGMELAEAVAVAVRGLQSAATGTGTSPATGTNGGAEDRLLGASALEVAVLDRNRPRRAFRRITGAALAALLPEENRRVDQAGEKAADAAEDESSGSGDTQDGSGSDTPSASS